MYGPSSYNQLTRVYPRLRLRSYWPTVRVSRYGAQNQVGQQILGEAALQTHSFANVTGLVNISAASSVQFPSHLSIQAQLAIFSQANLTSLTLLDLNPITSIVSAAILEGNSLLVGGPNLAIPINSILTSNSLLTGSQNTLIELGATMHGFSLLPTSALLVISAQAALQSPSQLLLTPSNALAAQSNILSTSQLSLVVGGNIFGDVILPSTSSLGSVASNLVIGAVNLGATAIITNSPKVSISANSILSSFGQLRPNGGLTITALANLLSRGYVSGFWQIPLSTAAAILRGQTVLTGATTISVANVGELSRWILYITQHKAVTKLYI